MAAGALVRNDVADFLGITDRLLAARYLDLDRLQRGLGPGLCERRRRNDPDPKQSGQTRRSSHRTFPSTAYCLLFTDRQAQWLIDLDGFAADDSDGANEHLRSRANGAILCRLDDQFGQGLLFGSHD